MPAIAFKMKLARMNHFRRRWNLLPLLFLEKKKKSNACLLQSSFTSRRHRRCGAVVLHSLNCCLHPPFGRMDVGRLLVWQCRNSVGNHAAWDQTADLAAGGGEVCWVSLRAPGSAWHRPEPWLLPRHCSALPVFFVGRNLSEKYTLLTSKFRQSSL